MVIYIYGLKEPLHSEKACLKKLIMFDAHRHLNGFYIYDYIYIYIYIYIYMKCTAMNE